MSRSQTALVAAFLQLPDPVVVHQQEEEEENNFAEMTPIVSNTSSTGDDQNPSQDSSKPISVQDPDQQQNLNDLNDVEANLLVDDYEEVEETLCEEEELVNDEDDYYNDDDEDEELSQMGEQIRSGNGMFVEEEEEEIFDDVNNEQQQQQEEEETYQRACQVRTQVYYQNLHRVLTNEFLLDVVYPDYPTFDSMQTLMLNHQKQQQQRCDQNGNSFSSEITTLFFGCLPSCVSKEQIISMINIFSGVSPLTVTITNTASNKSSVAHVQVRDCDCDIVIASIHKRVLFDEACFHYAQNVRAIEILHRYCAMLEHDDKLRFQSRPYTPIVCMRADNNIHVHAPSSHNNNNATTNTTTKNLIAQSRGFGDEYHPLCNMCVNYREQYTNNNFLFNTYLPQLAPNVIIPTREERKIGSNNLMMMMMMPVHSIRYSPSTTTSTTSAPPKWSPVSDFHLSKCTKLTQESWIHFCHKCHPMKSNYCQSHRPKINNNNNNYYSY